MDLGAGVAATAGGSASFTSSRVVDGVGSGARVGVCSGARVSLGVDGLVRAVDDGADDGAGAEDGAGADSCRLGALSRSTASLAALT